MTKSEVTLIIVKGITDHFKNKTLGITLFPQDLMKGDPELPAWVELRLVGPDFTDINETTFKTNVVCNILITTKIEELKNDYLAHLRNVVKALVPFESRTIQMGNGLCLTQDSVTRIRNYGSSDNNNLVVHSIIENAYYVDQENK